MLARPSQRANALQRTYRGDLLGGGLGLIAFWLYDHVADQVHRDWDKKAMDNVISQLSELTPETAPKKVVAVLITATDGLVGDSQYDRVPMFGAYHPILRAVWLFTILATFLHHKFNANTPNELASLHTKVRGLVQKVGRHRVSVAHGNRMEESAGQILENIRDMVETGSTECDISIEGDAYSLSEGKLTGFGFNKVERKVLRGIDEWMTKKWFEANVIEILDVSTGLGLEWGRLILEPREREKLDVPPAFEEKFRSPRFDFFVKFTQDEWDGFNIRGLTENHYVEVDGKKYIPSGRSKKAEDGRDLASWKLLNPTVRSPGTLSAST